MRVGWPAPRRLTGSIKKPTMNPHPASVPNFREILRLREPIALATPNSEQNCLKYVALCLIKSICILMQASPAKVIEYFNGEKQNLIPLFQRAYKWDEGKWRTLWEDILVQYDVADGSTHFMGAIVSVPAKSVPVGVSKYLIIDGQQRLTTISLLLCALRDILDNNTSARIQEVYIINRFREPEDTLKFVPTQVDRDTYRSIALDRAIPNDNSRMTQAYHYFGNLLRNGLDEDNNPIDPAKVLIAVEQSLQVVMINLGDNDDPYLIFESLNFKGEPLSQADLVRNYMLMRFKHCIGSGGEQERIYAKYWSPLQNQLGDNLTEFLRRYLMKEGDDIRLGGIYAATKARLRTLSEPIAVEQEFEQMLIFGSLYATILDPNLELDGAVRRRLYSVKELQVNTSHPLLLRLMMARYVGQLSSTDLAASLHLIESFVVRRAVCGVPTNALNKLFLQLARQFPTTNIRVWLLNSLSSGGGGRRFPSDTEFTEAFVNQPQYGRSATRFMLCALEEKLAHKEPAPLYTATIEHILPQTMSEEWKARLGTNADEIHQQYLHRMGNLTLTGYNTELGNRDFEEKKQMLQTTHFELNRWILDQENWDETIIQNRGKVMLTAAISLWPGPVVD